MRPFKSQVIIRQKLNADSTRTYLPLPPLTLPIPPQLVGGSGTSSPRRHRGHGEGTRWKLQGPSSKLQPRKHSGPEKLQKSKPQTGCQSAFVRLRSPFYGGGRAKPMTDGKRRDIGWERSARRRTQQPGRSRSPKQAVCPHLPAFGKRTFVAKRNVECGGGDSAYCVLGEWVLASVRLRSPSFAFFVGASGGEDGRWRMENGVELRRRHGSDALPRRGQCPNALSARLGDERLIETCHAALV
jgi:hypothetical protein